MTVVQKFILALTLVFFLLSVGTSGYILLEKLSFFDAVYMTVITVSTVGFQEVHELSMSGRIFTIFLISRPFFPARCHCSHRAGPRK